MANQSLPSNILQFQITSNKGNSIDMSAGVAEFLYYESVLSNNVTATVSFVETGNNDSGTRGGILDNLPIRGGERIDISMEDNYQNKFKYNNGLYVNRIRNAIPGTQKDVYFLDLASSEYFANEQVRVQKRYRDAPISTHVSEILKNILQTKEKIYVDTTSLNYNFYGNTRKPFYICTWLASKSVPQISASGGSGGNTLNGAAGYLFYQTRDGFHFKSIDNLFKQTAKKKYIYSNTPGTPEGYDASIRDYTIDTDMDLSQNLSLGTYNNVTFYYDPVSFNYKVAQYQIIDQKDKITVAGKQSEQASTLVSKDFTQSPTRLMTAVRDVGYNPPGVTTREQLASWKANPQGENFDTEGTMVQSIMRYNQLFTIQTNITIDGDFSIKAGDIIRCDFPSIGDESSTKGINRKTSGDYMVAHVCHRVTPTDTFTILALVRDSYGVKFNK